MAGPSVDIESSVLIAPSDPAKSTSPRIGVLGTVANVGKTALAVAEKAVDGVPVPGLKGAIAGINEMIRMAEASYSMLVLMKAP